MCTFAGHPPTIFPNTMINNKSPYRLGSHEVQWEWSLRDQSKPSCEVFLEYDRSESFHRNMLLRHDRFRAFCWPVHTLKYELHFWILDNSPWPASLVSSSLFMKSFSFFPRLRFFPPFPLFFGMLPRNYNYIRNSSWQEKIETKRGTALMQTEENETKYRCGLLRRLC